MRATNFSPRLSNVSALTPETGASTTGTAKDGFASATFLTSLEHAPMPIGGHRVRVLALAGPVVRGQVDAHTKNGASWPAISLM